MRSDSYPYARAAARRWYCARRMPMAPAGEPGRPCAARQWWLLPKTPGARPRNFDVDAYRRDLTSVDTLRPRAMRVVRLHERLQDTNTVLGTI
jgi:hypothetical protein